MQAARDAGALREAKDKLEKRVEELTWRIDFEKHLRVYLFLPQCSKLIRRLMGPPANKLQVQARTTNDTSEH